MQKSKFTTIWNKQILPELKKLKRERSKARRQFVWMLIAILGFVLVVAPLNGDLPASWWLAGLGVFVLAVAGWRWHANSNQFATKFKQHVFQAVANATEFSWRINPENEPEEGGEEVYQTSSLYHGESYVHADDVLVTYWQSADITAYEIKAEKSTGKHEITIFQGFIVKTAVNHTFSGKTFVQTESDSGFLGGVGGLFDWETEVEQTELEWGDFEQFLEVQSSDSAEAREIFTPDFMQVLYAWWIEHEKPLRLAFQNQAVYIAIPTEVTLEPHVFGSLKHERPVAKKMLEFLLFSEEVTQLVVNHKHIHHQA